MRTAGPLTGSTLSTTLKTGLLTIYIGLPFDMLRTCPSTLLRVNWPILAGPAYASFEATAGLGSATP